MQTRIAIAGVFVLALLPVQTSFAQTLHCTQVHSRGSFACNDAGGFASTCATARCPAGTTLTGGGGACAAGDRRIKSLFPRSNGEFGIACEQQGVAPQAVAVCCSIRTSSVFSRVPSLMSGGMNLLTLETVPDPDAMQAPEADAAQ